MIKNHYIIKMNILTNMMNSTIKNNYKYNIIQTTLTHSPNNHPQITIIFIIQIQIIIPIIIKFKSLRDPHLVFPEFNMTYTGKKVQTLKENMTSTQMTEAYND